MPSESKSTTPSRERERDITLRLHRDPKGAILKRDKAPVGLRTPNGFVWGHRVEHLFWMPRIPGTNALTVWSRSMLKAHGEGYPDDNDGEGAWPGEGDEPLVPPRILRPWPVLKVASSSSGEGEGEGEKSGEKSGANGAATLHPIDEGCNHEHPALKKQSENSADSADELDERGNGKEAAHVRATQADLSFMALMGECPDDPEEICTGPILFNAQKVKNARGELYGYVWCEHFRSRLMGLPDPRSVVVFAVAATGNPNLDADTTGICVKPARAAAAAGTATDRPAKTKGKGKASGGPAEKKASASDDSTDVVMSEETGAGDSSTPKANSVNDKPSASTRDLYSVEGLPKLEEFIPDQYFPDVLMVHDPDNTTESKKGDDTSDGDKDKPIMYKRYYPSFADPKQKQSEEGEKSEPAQENVAHLYLRKDNRFGIGNHSHVYRAPLTLPPPLSARSPTGQVTVAAKLAYHRCTAHGLLHNEARVYDTLPKDLQEDWCGYNVVPQCRFPVPVGAIAPKFFGYYLPVDDEGKPVMKRHANCSEEDPCRVEWPSPILLMEECGNPVEPSKFTLDQRTECFSLVLRLHHMDIVQGSFYVRNIMCQPGPLTLPLEKRSYDHPSFRIIDYGRGRCWDWEVEASAKDQEKKKKNRDSRRFEFVRKVGDEVARARKELLVPDFGF